MLSWYVFNAFWKLETVNRFTGTDSPSSSSSDKMLCPALPGLQHRDFIQSQRSSSGRSSKPLSPNHFHSITISATSFSASTQHSIPGYPNWPDMSIYSVHIFLQTAFISGILDLHLQIDGIHDGVRSSEVTGLLMVTNNTLKIRFLNAEMTPRSISWITDVVL